MGSKNKIILVGAILIVLLLSAIILLIFPKVEIHINGNKNMQISIGEEYHEEGAYAFLNKFGQKKDLNVKIIGKVDTNKIGKNIVTYKVNYKNREYNKIRIVNVIDSEKPVIKLNKEPIICQKNNLVEIDVTAIDNLDGDISDRVKYNIKDDKISIFVLDSSNNKAEIIQDLKYNDDEKPVINLIGSKTIYLNIGEEYHEEGAVAYDSCEGNITNKIEISSNLNNNIAGNYEVTYSVADNSKNEVKIIRNVIVSNIDNSHKVTDATIYLTFDDGPGQYTEEILGILNSYNIKATFFVTNQFPKYQNMIAKEFNNDHTVAIHTYSHKWSIYDSVDTYLDDFNKIQNIIISETGSPAKYFRFPGGSSNTVSRSHSKGIMTKLSNLMQENGYKYFDWSIDSGDTHKKNTKEYIINMVKSHLKGNGTYMILMHDIKKNTLLALPSIIEYGLQNGYTFEAIDDSTPEFHFKIAN